MRYLITGAAGFIGSHFVRELMAGSYDSLGHECTGVTVFDKLTYAGNQANLASVADDPRYTFVHGDICDGDLLDRAAQLVLTASSLSEFRKKASSARLSKPAQDRVFEPNCVAKYF